MYSFHQVEIEEFISSIPICQHGCALETILNASQGSKDGKIVIVDSHYFPLGIVTAHRLLSLIVKYQHNRRITTSVGSQQHRDGRAALMATTNIASLIEPIKILSSSTNISEFLSYSHRSLERQELNYAIIDERQKFLGMLDTQKLYEFLLRDANRQSQATALDTNLENSYLFDSIDNIGLPLTIRDDDGKILYQNQYWQEHLSQVRGRKTQENFYSCQIARWCSWQQQVRDGQQRLSNSLATEEATAEENIGRRLGSDFLSLFAAPNLQVSYLNGWYYLKIALNFPKIQSNNKSVRDCWLILGVEAEERDPDLFTEEVDWSQLKDQFLGYLSHELKSPLTGIVGLSNLLKAQKLGVLNQRQVNYVELIHRSGKQLTDMVNELLKLTSLPASKDLLAEPIDIETLCQQTYRQVISRFAETTAIASENEINFSSLELSIESSSQEVFVDKSCLTQILSHSLEWAVKSQPERLGITVNSWTGWLSIVVWYQTRVEETSPQFPNTQELETNYFKTAKNGNFGLLLARRLAKVHGGDLSLIYKASGRNELTLLLPQAAKNRPLVTTQTSTTRDRPLVLVVEHLPHRFARIATEIQDLGYHALFARSGIEALQQARLLKPSYILLNPTVPSLSGKDLLTLLKFDSNTQNIPIFILTKAQSKLEDSQSLRQAQGIICEPFDRGTLTKVFPVNKNTKLPQATLPNITVLCIYPEPEAVDESLIAKNSAFRLQNWTEKDWISDGEDDDKPSSTRYRIIEADGLEPAQMLARIWQIDVVVLDSVAIAKPVEYLSSLQQSSALASLPLIILDSKTSAAANQLGGLTVYPCLLPATNKSLKDLIQVIQIATSKNPRSQL